ncbi:hypothetical protein ACSQ76_16080 [Roseovarius sp. B08]|uniref:hypothetical protein n=1 Tax=Roseovarius sp. B08 TaxID=3449223 RepID=UPI003EDC0867
MKFLMDFVAELKHRAGLLKSEGECPESFLRLNQRTNVSGKPMAIVIRAVTLTTAGLYRGLVG